MDEEGSVVGNCWQLWTTIMGILAPVWQEGSLVKKFC